eukprot:m.16844 g.16844  ORF g.16844 m.16844 type:complete len:122 (+) comp8165_c1_seq1:161-526(+)
MSFIFLVLAAVCWGATNPLIKDGAAGIDGIRGSFLERLKFLISRWRFVLPFVINQCGSLFFALSLAAAPLGIVSTVVNALTFLFTALADITLGRRLLLSWKLVLGIALVIVGAYLTVSSET